MRTPGNGRSMIEARADFRVRPFAVGDAPQVVDVFQRSIHEVAPARYGPAQVEAWASAVPAPGRWLPYLIAFYTFVALDESGDVVAWIAMRSDGYVDMLFALPHVTRRGAASLLYDAIENVALDLDLAEMTAHASAFAEPFFARRGWAVVNRTPLERDGVEIPRAFMKKTLPGRPRPCCW